eukprot:jgi/Mesen1/6751/ME000344S06033
MQLQQGSWRLWWSLALVNLAAIMERADEGLLPAVYREVGVAFNASPSQLGSLTFIRAVVQAGSSPLAGFLALHYDRAAVIGAGTIFWALSTAAVGLAQSYWQCAIWRAVNGIGLAIVVPALQSFIADSYSDGSRGVAFGWLNLVGTVGAIGGGMTATILAGVSACIGWLVLTCVVDPRGRTSPSLRPLSLSDSLQTHRAEGRRGLAMQGGGASHSQPRRRGAGDTSKWEYI